MSKYIGIALATAVIVVQAQLQAGAQSPNFDASQPVPVLQPQSPANDGLRGPIDNRPVAPTSYPAPFSNTSSYSYTEPSGTPPGAQTSVTVPFPAPASTGVPSFSEPPSAGAKKQKKHGTSPVGAVFGVQDRAVKSSVGLTDRAAKASLGVSGKAVKEVFKTIF
jgi:hypothetical protein